METYIKAILFEVIAPIIYLLFFAYAFAIGSLKLAKAWKKKHFRGIWLYIWVLLVAAYFLVNGLRFVMPSTRAL